MASTKRKCQEEIIQTLRKNSRNGTGPPCRFDDAEIISLLEMFSEICASKGTPEKMDRNRFRDELQTCFKITDDFLMDRVFRAFDRDNDSALKQEEWVLGLHVFLRGDLEDKIKYCFLVYDLNGDGYISREEMFHLLKNCLYKQSSEEDPDEGVKDLVETVLKKLDQDHDGRVNLMDYRKAVTETPLLLESLGPCLPSQAACNEFLALMHGNLGQRSGMGRHHKQDEENKMIKHRNKEQKGKTQRK
ncbi:EF-hand calcium-binding domain-containing protein 1-like [Haliotis rubra]|uniref:EF-hand calcium-binding domain-containing protein 1-like n=1 Tax=Haliotis rubra TaxID=36100 RepID=UPI001EE60533|nr:EF-hand calcium-binding domain-containing protein 1-like [Haliotis rubra]